MKLLVPWTVMNRTVCWREESASSAWFTLLHTSPGSYFHIMLNNNVLLSPLSSHVSTLLSISFLNIPVQVAFLGSSRFYLWPQGLSSDSATHLLLSHSQTSTSQIPEIERVQSWCNFVTHLSRYRI